jgi:hypothetical protein
MADKNRIFIFIAIVALLIVVIIVCFPGVWRFIDNSKIVSGLVISAVLLGLYYFSRFFIKPKLITLHFDKELKVNYTSLSSEIYSNISLPFKFALIDIWSDDALIELKRQIKYKTVSGKSGYLKYDDYWIDYKDSNELFLPKSRDFKIKRYAVLLVDGSIGIKKRFFPGDGDLEFETEFRYRNIFGRKLSVQLKHKVINSGPSDPH